ncbi:MAG: hypothetical protein U1E53_00970 [Dongiaceae bacterium]
MDIRQVALSDEGVDDVAEHAGDTVLEAVVGQRPAKAIELTERTAPPLGAGIADDLALEAAWNPVIAPLGQASGKTHLTVAPESSPGHRAGAHWDG